MKEKTTLWKHIKKYIITRSQIIICTINWIGTITLSIQ